jgi:hypothetical protein
MNFIDIDLHTKRFTCCFRMDRSKANDLKDRKIKIFELNSGGWLRFTQR